MELKKTFLSPYTILYGVRLLPILETYLYILPSVRKEHTMSPPIHKYLFFTHSSLILSKILSAIGWLAPLSVVCVPKIWRSSTIC